MSLDLSNPLLVSAAQSVSTEPTLVQNRARAAVMVDMGFGALDTYSENKTLLFLLGLVGSGISGTLLYKRKSAEARALYSITLAASLALSWFTRPDAFRPAVEVALQPDGTPVPVTPAESTKQRLLGWLDQKAAVNTQQNPAWENETWSRLSQDLGAGTIPPAVTALLIS